MTFFTGPCHTFPSQETSTRVQRGTHDRILRPSTLIVLPFSKVTVQSIPVTLLNFPLVSGVRPAPAAKSAEKVQDPVRGMSIDQSVAEGQEEYKGGHSYFSSHECHSKFKEAPDKYAK